MTCTEKHCGCIETALAVDGAAALGGGLGHGTRAWNSPRRRGARRRARRRRLGGRASARLDDKRIRQQEDEPLHGRRCVSQALLRGSFAQARSQYTSGPGQYSLRVRG